MKRVKIVFLLIQGFLALVILLPVMGQQAYENGEQQSFNSDWLFSRGDLPGAEEGSFDDSGWQVLDLPHDWAIEGPFDEKISTRTGGLPVYGSGWYRKHFEIPARHVGKRVKIVFDGAMSLAKVWVNGSLVAERPYGYTTFHFDVTELLETGKENVIAVQLKPEDFSARWYPGAGIYRNTWIEYNHQVHFSQWGTYVTTPEVSKDRAQIQVISSIENSEDRSLELTLVSEILDPSGLPVAEESRTIKIAAGKAQDILQLLDVANPVLWDIDSPRRYRLLSKIFVEGNQVDSYLTPFGIRTIEFSASEGFKLNGRYLKLKGVCMHHDLGPLGSAVNRRATERQLEIMKSMGVNAIRTSHNPPSPELLEFCDRLGLMVQDEAFDCWQMAKVPNDYSKYFDDWFDDDLRSMIRRDRNHPSVIMWSIGNEILEQGNADKGWILARMLSEICHDEDDSRPTTAGFNYYPASVDNKLAEHIDIVGLNYHPASYSVLMEAHPEMIIYGSETSSCVSSRGIYHLPLELYDSHESLQISSYDLIGPPWAYPPDVEFMYQDAHPSLLGEFVWTGFDYLGEPTPFGGKDNITDGKWNADWPARSSYFGTVDLCGFPKDRYYLYQSQWTSSPMVHLLPHWNWQGREGEGIPVYGYTNCQEAELFLNGESLGKKVKGRDRPLQKVDYYNHDGSDFYTPYRLLWNVPYSSGELKIVAYNNGQAVAEKVIETAGKPARISLIPDRTEIMADGEDLSFITVQLEDKHGNPCPLADNLIEFEVSAEGKIKAVGNGNAATTESFRAPFRRAFNGKCMLIIASGDSGPGSIQIKARSKGLKSAESYIQTR